MSPKEKILIELETPEDINSDRFHLAMSIIFSEDDLRDFLQKEETKTVARHFRELYESWPST